MAPTEPTNRAWEKRTEGPRTPTTDKSTLTLSTGCCYRSCEGCRPLVDLQNFIEKNPDDWKQRLIFPPEYEAAKERLIAVFERRFGAASQGAAKLT